MIPLTHCFGWTKGSRDEQKNWLREFAENGAEHLVLTNGLLAEGLKDSAYLMEFAKDMKEFGLDFVDSHALWGMWADPGIPAEEWREIMLLRHRMAFRFCQHYGVHTMTFHTGNTFNSVYGKDLTLDDYYNALIRSLEILLPDAEKCGVVIALENIWTPLNHSRQLLRVMKHFQSSNLGLCYDSGHGNLMEKGQLFPGQTCVPPIWNDLGIPVEWEEDLIEKMSPWLVNCHLHDNNGIMDEHKLPGEGTVDWQRVKSVLRKSPKLQCIQNESSAAGLSIEQRCRTYRELLQDFSN